MDTQETTLILCEVSNHVGILEYNQLLTDTEIDWLVQDYDFEYDSYFKGEMKQ